MSTMAASVAPAGNPFAPSEFERRKARRARRSQWLLLACCLLLVIPVVAILVYVFVRADISLPDQIVQVGHACLEAGHHFKQPKEPCNLVLLSVSSEEHLREAVEQAELAGVQSFVFYEPDNGLGLTAACTEPITGSIRRVFRRIALWQQPDRCVDERGPPKGLTSHPSNQLCMS